MGRRSAIKIQCDRTDGCDRIHPDTLGAAFAEDIAPTDVFQQWADEVHAAVAAARRRGSFREIVDQRRTDDMELRRMRLQRQIAELERELATLPDTQGDCQ